MLSVLRKRRNKTLWISITKWNELRILQVERCYLATGVGLDQRINNGTGLRAHAVSLILLRDMDQLKSSLPVHPFCEVPNLLCSPLFWRNKYSIKLCLLFTSWSAMLPCRTGPRLCSAVSRSVVLRLQTSCLLRIYWLADTLQTGDFGCPAKQSLRVGQAALLEHAIFSLQKCCIANEDHRQRD